MIDLPLPKELVIALLSKLANDDVYRARFEHDPSEALATIGFPADLVVRFATAQQKLADKAEFEAARKRLTGEVVSDCLCMVVPSLMLSLNGMNSKRSAA